MHNRIAAYTDAQRLPFQYSTSLPPTIRLPLDLISQDGTA
jgi:hypothetical protein